MRLLILGWWGYRLDFQSHLPHSAHAKLGVRSAHECLFSTVETSLVRSRSAMPREMRNFVEIRRTSKYDMMLKGVRLYE